MSRTERQAYAEAFRGAGYSIRNSVLSMDVVAALREATAKIVVGDEVKRRRSIYGIRNLLEISPEVRAAAAQPNIRQFVTPILGEQAFAARAILFDKVADANWSLFWHQDNVIAVKQRRAVDGFVGWAQKAGVWQVQPPVEVLGRMVAVRIHLDDCGADNGPLRVVPGSHAHGWLDEQLEEWKRRVPEVVCEVDCGGVVTMSPLTLHASAPARKVGRRRVIHIEYAVDELPGGLEWNNRVGPA
jgi:ectoine hydroxylase-related dioxygenase (phytanoyl-CoA dioxygenase family)